MNALIAYDVSGKQDKVKKGMQDKGYLDFWTHQGKTYNLPDTTLWKKNTTLDQAFDDLTAVVDSIPVITVQRAVVTPCDEWVAIPGQPHADTE
ncbi:MAG: hypothetical protein EPO40_28050 [Myxococcaceae bacterium]|nr:MAG: hypothetical protein EPO40_28050 [Myxococcaceae bacterium]